MLSSTVDSTDPHNPSYFWFSDRKVYCVERRQQIELSDQDYRLRTESNRRNAFLSELSLYLATWFRFLWPTEVILGCPAVGGGAGTRSVGLTPLPLF